MTSKQNRSLLNRRMNLPQKNPGVFAEMPTYKIFGGERFRLSLANPDFFSSCNSSEATKRGRQLRKEGWNVRMTRVKYSGGYAYILYERRSHKQATEMRKATAVIIPGRGKVSVTQGSVRRG